MTPYDPNITIVAIDPSVHSHASEIDLNEALRTLAVSRQADCRSKNVSLFLDLAADLPKAAVDGEQIRSVLQALFSYAQTAILRNGMGTIGLRTQKGPERLQCSITCAGSSNLRKQLLEESSEGCVESSELTTCAEIIQDQGGELYVWRPRVSGRLTITLDLPT